MNPVSSNNNVGRNKRIREFWTHAVPMTFQDKPITYEEKRKFRYQLQDYMKDVFRFDVFSGKKILELGSGAGIDSAEFLRNGAQVVSLDFSPLSAMSTKLLLREANLDGYVLLADSRHLPFNSSQFDLVYSFGVIHHIPDVSRVLEEVTRVLKSGGSFMGMVYNRDSLLYAYSIVYLHGIKDGLLAKGLSEGEITAKFSERFTGNVYTMVYTKEQLTDLLKRFFDSVWVGTYYNVIDTTDERKVKFQLEGNRNDLGWHLVFKASKQ